MKTGILKYDFQSKRLYVLLDDGSVSNDFHCGDTLDLLCPCCKEWRPCRVEYANDWCLVGLGQLGMSSELYLGQQVRID